MSDWLPEGAVPVSRIEIVEYLDAETGEQLVDQNIWTADGSEMALYKVLGLLEIGKVQATVLPIVQPALGEDRDA